MKETKSALSWVKGLQRGEKWAIEQLYREAYPSISMFIKKNSGTEEDAKDLFQDCLLILIPKLRETGLQITVSPSTYLYAIARNQWKNKLRKKRKNPIDLILDEPDMGMKLKEIEGFDFKENQENEKGLLGLLRKLFKKLGEDCQKIIQLKHIYKYSHEEIVETMDYSPEYSRSKLNRCMSQLRKMIKEDSIYKPS